MSRQDVERSAENVDVVVDGDDDNSSVMGARIIVFGEGGNELGGWLGASGGLQGTLESGVEQHPAMGVSLKAPALGGGEIVRVKVAGNGLPVLVV